MRKITKWAVDVLKREAFKFISSKITEQDRILIRDIEHLLSRIKNGKHFTSRKK